MKEINGYAEQCKDWSEEFTTDFNSDVAYAPARDRQAVACPQCAGDSWIPDHAIHALWQTALPVCDWARAWTQVLSVGEQSWTTAHAYLCPADNGGAGAGATSSTADGAHALRGVVRHWLRIAHAPCRPVTRSDGVGQHVGSDVCGRYHGRQSTRGQHVGTRREGSALAYPVTGGGAPCARR
jgi:hypothetical protein